MQKLKPIARKRRNFAYLLFSILFSIVISYVFLNFPPDYKFNIYGFRLPLLPLFLISVFCFVYSLLAFIFIRKTQGLLIGAFLVGYSLMRIIGLTHWIFGVLLISLFITLELFILKKK